MEVKQKKKITRQKLNPWTSVWFRPKDVVDSLKNSNWGGTWGVMSIFLAAIADGGTELIRIVGGGPLMIFAVLLCLGCLAVLGVYFVAYIILGVGKIWNGQASVNSIFTVLALSFIPEILKLVNLAWMLILHKGNFDEIQIHGALYVVCWIISLRILIVGIARVQRFNYGIAFLNIILPGLFLAILAAVVKQSLL